MVRHHGYRAKTRRIFRKHPRKRGLAPLGRYLVDYEVGDKVDVIADPSVHKHGFPHKRFHGKTGTIVGVRGRCFEVRVKDQKKVKMLVLGVEHMRKSNLGQNSA
ncbi:MAG: 50S ribosomal protein L21e [Promethearchaeota archaeon]